ncbi:ferritin-like domain-containing protein [Larkinella soli]|uniref:ferritin-like domain-containing protein n=1 Tax=Larkinella soli TaxID=1770527 RepID=UPI000FFCA5E7|nr:ferritin-like domain-containing protein [Larkinella soli]
MNLLNILSEIGKADADTPERYDFSRRKLLKTTAAAAVITPAFVAATINKAFGADKTVTDILNFALTLEYLEAEFYKMALSMPNLIPAGDRDLFTYIAKHEKEHVEFLKMTLGPDAIGMPQFDFTAGGKYPTAFSSYDTFLVLSQSFEDLGVRAYKGQAPFLKPYKEILLAALKIHSVEARHAGEVRLIRGLRVWASEQETGGAPAAVYMGENNFLTGIPVDVIQLASSKYIQQNGGALHEKLPRESFDEPLTKEQVLAIAMPFIKAVNP